MTTKPIPTTQSRDRVRPGEPGFTLVEALIAVIILAFGLIAVAQLLAVAASSNSTANGTSAAAAAASQELERLQTVSFTSLTTGGSLDPMTPASGPPCTANYYTDRQIPGVGTVRTCWRIETVSGTTNTNLRFITVRSQVLGPFSNLSRAEFTTFRSLNGSTPTPAP